MAFVPRSNPSGTLRTLSDTTRGCSLPAVVIECRFGETVTKRDRDWAKGWNRRRALQGMASFLAGSPLLRGQQDPFRDHSRIPALAELKTALDFEPVAYAKLLRYAYDYTAYG